MMRAQQKSNPLEASRPANTRGSKRSSLLLAATVSSSLLSPFSVFAQNADPDSMAAPLAPETTVEENLDYDQIFDQSWLEEKGAPIDFGNPWILLGLPFGLLALNMLLRSQPLRPKDQEFGPMFILERLQTHEAVPDEMPLLEKMPWFLSLTAAFIAVSDPQLIKQPIDFKQDGPVLIAVDNGAMAAPSWAERREAIHEIIQQAANDGRGVSFLLTAPTADDAQIYTSPLMNPAVAHSFFEGVSTEAWLPDLQEAEMALETLPNTEFGSTFWISNGLQDDHTLSFAMALNTLGPLQIYEGEKPHLLMPAEYGNGAYDLRVKRAEIGEESLSISVYDAGGNALGAVPLAFDEFSLEASIRFAPQEFDIKGENVFRFSIDGEYGVGSSVLVDTDAKPRSVGIAVRGSQDNTQSLLNESRFLNAALEPYTETYINNIDALLDGGDISVLILPDAVPLSPEISRKIERWVSSDGGMLIRFAGDNLAREGHQNDPLLPVDLLEGAQDLTPSLTSVEQALTVQDFAQTSPYKDIATQDNIAPEKRLVIEPDSLDGADIWASLSDGSPLVVSRNLGEGSVVLFNTSANLSWSDFALSPNFVEMLVETVREAKSIEQIDEHDIANMAPIKILNASGQLRDPSAIVKPLDSHVIQQGEMSPYHPPGLYGNNLQSIAYNFSEAVPDIVPLSALPESLETNRHVISQTIQDNKKLADGFWAGALMLSLIGSAFLSGAHRNLGRRRNKNADIRPDQGPDITEELGL